MESAFFHQSYDIDNLVVMHLEMWPTDILCTRYEHVVRQQRDRHGEQNAHGREGWTYPRQAAS